jgi:hypothetical protein
MEASHDALREGMAPLESGTAPGSDTPTEISPDARPQKTQTQRSATTKHHLVVLNNRHFLLEILTFFQPGFNPFLF